jgi:hypothetical protein
MITISRDGQQYGPYSPEDARTLIYSGQLTRNDLAWREGESDWRTLGDVLGLPAAPPTPQAAENVVFNERNVSVSNKQIIVNGQIFVVKNIGGVTIQTEPARTGGYIGLLILAFIGVLPGLSFLAVPDVFGAGLFILAIALFVGFLGIMGLIRSKPTYYIGLTAAGGLQRAYGSQDKDFIDRLVRAIQDVII